jgi:diphthamide biosynthesis protein 7
MVDTFATFDTIETADCVESCPIQGLESTMIVATYQLHKQRKIETNEDDGETVAEIFKDKRTGTLQHFEIKKYTQNDIDVRKVEHIESSSGIFDIKWATHRVCEKALLGSATAGGVLEIFQLSEKESDRSLELLQLSPDTEEDSMCLSLDWDDRAGQKNEPSICVSHSDG